MKTPSHFLVSTLRPVYIVLAAILCTSMFVRAEDGYELWLRYRLEENAARRNEYINYCGGGIVALEQLKNGAAWAELTRALPVILGCGFQSNDSNAGCIYIGGKTDHPAIAALVREDAFASMGDEGFVVCTDFQKQNTRNSFELRVF